MDFLDNQASFVSVFGLNPVMLRVSKRATGTCAIEDTGYLATKLGKYCDTCQLHLFCDIIKLQFVGTTVYNSHRMMHNIYLSLSSLKLESRANGNTTYLTPDSLFQRFIEFTSLLFLNATSWSFSLVTLFYNALSIELQEFIRLDGYLLPNNSTLPTLFDQKLVLQALREIAVVAHQSLAIEKKRVLTLINFVAPRNPKLTNYAADVNNMQSQAEETICSHISNNNHCRADRPLVKGKDGKFNLKNPESDYVSRFADGFRGCFGCGSDAHQFRTCP